MKEEKYTAQKKYKKENIKKITIEFNKKYDNDILEYLKTLDNKSDFFKRIIREQIKN